MSYDLGSLSILPDDLKPFLTLNFPSLREEYQRLFPGCYEFNITSTLHDFLTNSELAQEVIGQKAFKELTKLPYEEESVRRLLI